MSLHFLGPSTKKTEVCRFLCLFFFLCGGSVDHHGVVPGFARVHAEALGSLGTCGIRCSTGRAKFTDIIWETLSTMLGIDPRDGVCVDVAAGGVSTEDTAAGVTAEAGDDDGRLCLLDLDEGDRLRLCLRLLYRLT